MCLKRTLCGHGEKLCEKLVVLTALKQFQCSVGAGGVWACCIFRQDVRVRIGSVHEWTGEHEMNGRVLFQSSLLSSEIILYLLLNIE